MKRFKRHALAAIILSALPLVVMAAVNWIVDPFNLFGGQPFQKTRYYVTNDNTERQRLHAFGLIYSHIARPDAGYDAILAGSSRTTGMSAVRIAVALGLTKVADLSLIGSRGVENRAVVERALETGRISTVLWEIDYWFVDPREPPTNIPSYLLTRTRFDDLRYLFTPFVFRDSFDLLSGRNPQHWTEDLEKLNNPMKFFSRATFDLASSRITEKLKPIPRTTAFDPTQWNRGFPRLDEDILSVVRRFPEVRFIVFFPLVPNLLYAADPPERFAAVLGGRRYLVEQTQSLPNLRVFAFDADPKLAGNLANFSDPNHCGHGADGYLFECFATGRNELTQSTIAEYERAFIDRVDNFAPHYDPATALGPDPAWGPAK